jgi:DinB superfamily
MSDDLDRLRATRAAYAALQPRVVAGEPWPLAAAFGTEPEAAWGPRELLAHVAEMLPFWLAEMERVIDGPPGGGPTPFGRVADDHNRIAIIERDRTLPLRVLFGRVDAGLREWADRLGSLTDDERARVGLHPRLGEMSVAAMPERFVLGHAEEHIAQLEGILAGGAAPA